MSSGGQIVGGLIGGVVGFFNPALGLALGAQLGIMLGGLQYLLAGEQQDKRDCCQEEVWGQGR